MKKLLISLAAVSMLGTPALAASCRDTKGKFIKCAEKAPVKVARCKNAKGQFAKCGTKGAKPM